MDKRVLCIAESDTDRSYISKCLKSENYKTISINNNIESLGALDANVFDLLIIDMDMISMDSLNTFMKLRKRTEISIAPVIAISNYDYVSTLTKTLDTGVDVFLVKPFRPIEFLHLVGDLLEIKQY